MISEVLDQPKARAYGALCLDYDTGTGSKWWYMTHAAYRANSDFHPFERIVLNEFKCVCSAFSRGILGLIWSITYTKFACCYFKLRRTYSMFGV